MHSPDAPSVDIYVDGKAAFKGAAYKDVTDYAPLSPGEKKGTGFCFFSQWKREAGDRTEINCRSREKLFSSCPR